MHQQQMCPTCGRILLFAHGDHKKKCEKCGEWVIPLARQIDALDLVMKAIEADLETRMEALENKVEQLLPTLRSSTAE